MMATNHVLSGAAFASLSVTHLPVWLILPVAFLLHFVMDALPHFGDPSNPARALARLKWILPIDMAVAAGILIAIAVVQPAHWPVLMAAGVLCASPDLWSITRFIRFLRTGDTAHNTDWFAQFHYKIQWGERLWGAWVELVWAISMVALLSISFWS